jgi:enoyl-CoA hydratase
MSNAFETIRVERAGPVAELVLNRPGWLNAMDPLFFRELKAAMRSFGEDDAVRCVLIWAEGRVFSSGLDQKSTTGLLPAVGAGVSEARRRAILFRTITEFQDCLSSVRACRKPVVSAVHGLCLGGGLDLVTACDIRLCSAQAAFAVHETRVAMLADLGTVQRLASLVGRGVARELAFTGRQIAAERALACGLVNEVLPDKDALLAAARALCGEIAANAPWVVQGVKYGLDFAADHGEAAGLHQAALWNSAFFFSDDLDEAGRAFAERRVPDFKGS